MHQITLAGNVQRNCIMTGRASVGIYLILKSCFPEGTQIVVPANLCYAAIYPALYAKARIRFCDVDAISGNMTKESLAQACTKETGAVIVPHMYGNPVSGMLKIKEYCQQNHILLIEDCASAMGAEADYCVGAMGDYSVFSTGYSKTIDLGFGGGIWSERDLSSLEEQEKELPLLESASQDNMAFFSKLYRLIRNTGKNTQIEQAIFKAMPECLQNSFVHCITKQDKRWLTEQLVKLPDIVQTRRKKWASYVRKLEKVQDCIYPFSPGAVPWRMNLLIDPQKKAVLIEEALRHTLPVSDWYPLVTPLFFDGGSYPCAQQHAERIVNFPLLLEEGEIDQICILINRICGEHRA